MNTQRQFFRQALKVELKGYGRRRTLKKILRANRRKPTLGNMVMLALGLKVE